MKRLIPAALLCTLPSLGAIVAVDATSSGFYSDAGSHTAGNYAIGWYTGQTPTQLRNYLIFDLSGITGTINSATLRLQNGGGQTSSYISNDPSETFALFSVSIAAATLSGGTGGIAGFSDLGDGTQYGSISVSGLSPDPIDTAINSSGLAYLNGKGIIVFGGALTSLAFGSTIEAQFNGTNGGLTRQLILDIDESTVPEPATLLLAGAALTGFAIWRRRRRA